MQNTPESEASACQTGEQSGTTFSVISATNPPLTNHSGEVELVAASEKYPSLRDYKVIGRAGHGGQGTVWIAEEEVSGMRQRVAIKINKGANESLVQREVKNLSNVKSPHVVTYRHCLRTLDNNDLAIVMDFIEGQSLDLLISNSRGNRIRWKGAVTPTASSVIRGVLDGLAYLHSMEPPIIHRDIKPANIMISSRECRAVLVDLGLSKRSNSNQTITQEGWFLGTIGYMSPEMAEGRVCAGELDARADIWATGVVLHEMLTGDRLFPQTDIMVAAREIRGFKFSPLQLKPKVPGLNLALKKMLEVDSSKRYKNAVDALDTIKYLTDQDLSRPLLEKKLAPVLLRYFLRHWEEQEGSAWSNDSPCFERYWEREAGKNKKRRITQNLFKSGNSSEWDLTALFAILLYSRVHPLPKNSQDFRDLTAFRLWRNKLSHAVQFDSKTMSLCSDTVWKFLERHQDLFE